MVGTACLGFHVLPLGRLQLLLARLMVSRTGETRDAQQMIGDAGQRRDYYDLGKHPLALTHVLIR